jgi:hypothetical protein
MRKTIGIIERNGGSNIIGKENAGERRYESDVIFRTEESVMGLSKPLCFCHMKPHEHCHVGLENST